MADGVALYLRVSTEDQDLAGQERELRAYAAVKGWVVVSAYREKASASGRVEREQFEQLRRDARLPEDRGFGHILVWALDRWSREQSFVKAVGSIEELECLGIQFHSFKEPWVDSVKEGAESLTRDILRGILPTIASFESRRRSERTRLAMAEIRSGRRRTRTGRPPGRPRKIMPEHIAAIVRLRDQVPRPKWREIAVRLKIPAGTCKKVYQAFRRDSARVEKGQAGFVAAPSASQEVGDRAR